MAALLVGLTIMALFLSMALPAWRTAAQREREEELIFRGQQYARAIALFQRKYANTFPPNLNILLDGHFLRKKYKDPMTGGDFQIVYANQQAQAGTGGIAPTPGQTTPGGTGVVPTQGQPAPRTTTVGNGTTAGAQGGLVGVASKSTATSLRVYNGRTKYNEWVFVAQQLSGRIGAPNGSQTPTGGINLPGGPPGARGGRGNFPPGVGPGRGPGNQTPGPFGTPSQGTPFGNPGQGTPFGTPFGGGGVGGPGRGR